MSGEKPVAADLVPTRSEAFKAPPERPRPCVACAGYHGGVNAGLLCLERELGRTRAEVVRLRDELTFAATQIGTLRATR